MAAKRRTNRGVTARRVRVTTPNTYNRRRTVGRLGATFSPPSIPPAFSAPRPIITEVEFQTTVESSTWSIVKTSQLTKAIRDMFSINSAGSSTSDFSYSLMSAQLWMIPDKNDLAWGQLTVQFIDSPVVGSAVLRQVIGYGSGDRAARVGYHYPTAVSQLPIQDAADYELLRVRRDSRSVGASGLVVRFMVELVLSAGNGSD